jgi:hypothetical protein
VKFKLLHCTSPVAYGQLDGALFASPHVVAAATVVIVNVFDATPTCPAVLHSVSFWAYSPCREITVHAELNADPENESENSVFPFAAGGAAAARAVVLAGPALRGAAAAAAAADWAVDDGAAVVLAVADEGGAIVGGTGASSLGLAVRLLDDDEAECWAELALEAAPSALRPSPLSSERVTPTTVAATRMTMPAAPAQITLVRRLRLPIITLIAPRLTTALH